MNSPQRINVLKINIHTQTQKKEKRKYRRQISNDEKLINVRVQIRFGGWKTSKN